MKELTEDLIREQIRLIGDDPYRQGVLETPARVLKSWKELYSGYTKDPKEVFKTFDSGTYDQMVICKDIEFYSTCEHHMLPFFGVAHVAYIPDKRVIGLSKLARLLDIYARRLQIQERIGEQVTTDLMTYLEPKGAACIIEAAHMCMRMRGANKQHSEMVTSSLKGVFFTNVAAREELLAFIKR